MEITIITGMSGAGKSTALKFLEDFGYHCIDNLPAELITELVNLFSKTTAGESYKIALGMDIRNFKNDFKDFFDEIENLGLSFKIIYLHASTERLVQRYKETRRQHPLSNSILEGIIKESELLAPIKTFNPYIVDTTHIKPNQLRQKLEAILNKTAKENFTMTIISFGFKYGIPTDADNIFDVRFIENPFYIPELKHQTGNDEAVSNFVLEKEPAKTFLEKSLDMIEYLIPYYIKENKNSLIIAIGCTGGQHRSVSIANAIYDSLKEKYNIALSHREISRYAK
ncbi:MAG: RNase adapter RapZ [Defluviitaleaceae bacterium]|nr:RNase adapter RapZ [Defluviitaleaceae bacterium]